MPMGKMTQSKENLTFHIPTCQQYTPEPTLLASTLSSGRQVSLKETLKCQLPGSGDPCYQLKGQDLKIPWFLRKSTPA